MFNIGYFFKSIEISESRNFRTMYDLLNNEEIKMYLLIIIKKCVLLLNYIVSCNINIFSIY